MLERVVPALRITCLVLGGIVLLQLALLALHRDPLAGVRIPAALVAASGPKAQAASSTNKSTGAQGTNRTAASLTNQPGATGSTNKAPATGGPPVLSGPPGPSRGGMGPGFGPGMGPGFGPGMGPGFGPGMGPGQPASLPTPVQLRVDRITQSEILGPVMRPPPMALLGIAGKDVFFRAPSGQTGLLREGEELGGVKLLQVGTNRVVVEHEGKRQELTIFSGFGSETLLGKDNPQ